MGIVKGMYAFCYVECDGQNCNKKIEKNGEDALKQLAKICGWEHRDDRWLCPECVKKESSRKKAKKEKS